MKKLILVALCVALLTGTLAVGAQAEAQIRTGIAKGFGGEVTVNVTLEGETITAVEAMGEQETDGIGSRALEELPALIVSANSADVDVVAGATVTSTAVMAAVKNALDPDQYPYVSEPDKAAEEVAAMEEAEVTLGFGMSSSGRVGPGSDDAEIPVYSFNQVLASVLFDKEGRVVKAYVDQVEVATPNYDGASMPHFSGFPGQVAYNYDSDHDEKIDSAIEPTEETFLSEIAGWATKRERGEDYRLGTGTWTDQMNTYQKVFVGKTVEEIEAWFTAYCSNRNGRPLKPGSENAEDAAKFDALSEDEQAMLVDVVSSATMSLNDAHGDIISAIEKAYENRRPLPPMHATSMGQALVSTGRVGPGKDDTETPVYSINEVYVTTLFDEEGRVAAMEIDEMETATPNYDGESMPHFSGYPGHGGYNYDENHDEKVDTKLEPTDDSFLAELAGWTTKRERGEGYRLTTGTWASQMDAFQNLFVGKTVEEIEAWFAAYCSDRNGRPLKPGSENAEDAAKFDALSEDEQAMLADVVSSATISLNDPHGDIIGAIVKSFDNRFEIDLTVG